MKIILKMIKKFILTLQNNIINNYYYYTITHLYLKICLLISYFLLIYHIIVDSKNSYKLPIKFFFVIHILDNFNLL